MKTNMLYALLAIMLCLNFWQITRNKQLNVEIQIVKNEIMHFRDLEIIKDRKNLEFESTIQSINLPIKCIVEKINPAPYSFIYVYTDTQCSKCITKDIAIIRNNFKKNEATFFPVINDTRSNRAVLSSDLYNQNYIRLDKGSVVFPKVNGKSVRFMAVINSNGQILNPFYLSIANEKQKVQYLKFVKKRYCL